jgi:farnesyl-diphosphate farnesyltransferase
MARWQKQGPYVKTETELDDYMHYVAGLVGYLLTDLFAWHSPRIKARKNRLQPLSREFGLALQTVNVIRGLRKDYERGWVFVPQTYLNQVDLNPDQLFMANFEEKGLQVVRMLADKAEQHLQHGLEYILTIPRTQHRIRLFCIWPLFFATKTLAVSRNNVAVLRDEAKMSRDQVKTIVRDTTLNCSSHDPAGLVQSLAPSILCRPGLFDLRQTGPAWAMPVIVVSYLRSFKRRISCGKQKI